MIRKTFASLLLLLILILAPLLSILYATFETYLNPNFYQDEKIINYVYDSIISYGSSTMSAYIAQSGNPDLLTEDEIKEKLQKLITFEIFSELNKDFFIQITKTPLPDQVTIDLTEIKETLPTAVKEIVTEYIGKLKPCTEAEIATMTSGIPTCLPEGTIQDEIIPSLTDIESSDIYKNIPSQLNLNLNVIPAQSKMLIELVIQKNTLIRGILIGIFLLLIALMGLIIFKPIKSVLRWVANAFFWSGLPLIFMNMTIEGTVKAVTHQIAAQNPNIDLTLYEQTIQFAITFIKFLTDKMVFHGTVMVILGAVLFIISFIIPKKDDDIKGR